MELVTPSGIILPSPVIEVPRLKQIVPTSPWIPTRDGAELAWSNLSDDVKKLYDRIFKAGSLKEKFNILRMSGSTANYGSKQLQDSMWGATGFSAAATIYFGLWEAALDDTFNGATASESAYTSYARLGLTNNTTIFAAGSGTTTYQKQFPSDAAKSFATSTGGTSTVIYLGALDGNLGTSADNGYAWCSVTSTAINSGDTPQLAQNAITVTQD